MGSTIFPEEIAERVQLFAKPIAVVRNLMGIESFHPPYALPGIGSGSSCKDSDFRVALVQV
jgi:hypothetical protein